VAAQRIDTPHEALGFREALFRQGDNLAAAAEAARDAIAGADLDPLRRGVLVLTGIGASWHALAPAVRALRHAGRRAFAVHPSDLADARAAELGDSYLVVSQSGTSAETVAALEHLDGAYVAAISAHPGAPIAEAADLWLPLGALADTPVATLSYTATLQGLGLLCEAVTGIERRTTWERVPGLVRQTLEACEPAARTVAERFKGIHALDAIGGVASLASVGETALLAREALLLPATGSETRQYLHGPLEAAGAGLGCIVFGSGRELSLASSLASYGAGVAIVTDRAIGPTDELSVLVTPSVAAPAAPILEILPAQLIVAHLAEARGLEIGELRRRQADTSLG
jgi:glutamine---fructose-6-phosphate transaminase (isomerizing)